MASDDINWTFWVDQIKDGMCTPLIADGVARDFVFGANNDLIDAWAAAVAYPMADRGNLAHVAHFHSIVENDQLAAKRSYLRHLTQTALTRAEALRPPDQPPPPPGDVSGRGSTFSDTAARLGLADFTRQPDNPFFIMANLPIPVYLTTGYHTLLEQALKLAGRQPVTDYYRWNDDLDQTPKEEQTAYLHQPSVQEPLVYHLHGIDQVPDSLVMTEENYLEFYERASTDLNRQDGFPVPVRNALTKNSIMLLGYDLQSWAFRVVFRGPIRALFTLRRPLSLAIQLDPSDNDTITDQKQFRGYVGSFFDEYRFGLFWGDTAGFTSKLWQAWEKV